jgi:hypothetical protein
VSNNLSASISVQEPPKLMDQVRDRLRIKHYSLRTEMAYSGWIKRYIFFHGKRHPVEMGKNEVEAFYLSGGGTQCQRGNAESGFECFVISLPRSAGHRVALA